VATSNVARAAARRDAESGPLKIEQLPGRLNLASSPDATLLQLSHLTRRFGASPDRAKTIAVLVFGEVRS